MTIYPIYLQTAPGLAVDKRTILKALNDSGVCALLTQGEIGLYLLLLAAVTENGQGVLPRRAVQRALGMVDPPGSLPRACLRLQELGLIELELRAPRHRREVRYRIRQPLSSRGRGHAPTNRDGDHDEPNQG